MIPGGPSGRARRPTLSICTGAAPPSLWPRGVASGTRLVLAASTAFRRCSELLDSLIFAVSTLPLDLLVLKFELGTSNHPRPLGSPWEHLGVEVEHMCRNSCQRSDTGVPQEPLRFLMEMQTIQRLHRILSISHPVPLQDPGFLGRDAVNTTTTSNTVNVRYIQYCQRSTQPLQPILATQSPLLTHTVKAASSACDPTNKSVEHTQGDEVLRRPVEIPAGTFCASPVTHRQTGRTPCAMKRWHTPRAALRTGGHHHRQVDGAHLCAQPHITTQVFSVHTHRQAPSPRHTLPDEPHIECSANEHTFFADNIFLEYLEDPGERHIHMEDAKTVPGLECDVRASQSAQVFSNHMYSMGLLGPRQLGLILLGLAIPNAWAGRLVM